MHLSENTNNDLIPPPVEFSDHVPNLISSKFYQFFTTTIPNSNFCYSSFEVIYSFFDVNIPVTSSFKPFSKPHYSFPSLALPTMHVNSNNTHIHSFFNAPFHHILSNPFPCNYSHILNLPNFRIPSSSKSQNLWNPFSNFHFFLLNTSSFNISSPPPLHYISFPVLNFSNFFFILINHAPIPSSNFLSTVSLHSVSYLIVPP